MSRSIEVLRTTDELRAWRRAQGDKVVGFVPTMGALHAGHGRLLAAIRPDCDVSVLSIFVNPTQFGPNEDLAKYPRAFERDLELARQHGVDAVFAPAPDAMYPPGYSTYVEETQSTLPLCGAFRPGHFKGVTTIVLKLLNLVQPKLALFGLKDAQQFFVLHKMARDLDLDIAIEAVATVRENDGLALSSRNVYLGSDERKRAPLLQKSLAQAATRIREGQAITEALDCARRELLTEQFDLQYFDCRSLPDLTAANDTLDATRPYLIATAAYLGKTRLIDNVLLNAEALARFGVRVRP